MTKPVWELAQQQKFCFEDDPAQTVFVVQGFYEKGVLIEDIDGNEAYIIPPEKYDDHVIIVE